MVQFDIEDASFSPYMEDSIISLFVWDTEFLARCFYTVSMKFLTGERKIISDLCYEHFNTYKEAPGEYLLEILQNYLSRRPSNKNLLMKYLNRLLDINPNRGYVINTFGTFIRSEICKNAIDQAKILIDKGKLKEAEDLIYSEFRDAKLITGRIFEDILESTAEDFVNGEYLETNIKTFVEPYDKITGGWHRPEFVLLFGDYNVGKTFIMVHIGKVSALQGKNVLHITLETPKDELKIRYASSFTSTIVKHRESDVIDVNEEFTIQKLKKKLLFLKHRGGKIWLHQAIDFSFNDLVSLCNELEVVNNAVPDVIILDSPAQMNMERAYKDEWGNEKLLYKRLLDFSKERNVTLIVTDWAQRQKGERQSMSKGYNIGGSIAKVQIVDTGITLSQNEAENKEGKLIWFQFRSRGAEKFIMVEIQQDLKIGQAVVDAKLIQKDSKIQDEIRKMEKRVENNDKEKNI
jgi:KaiC/GvpD/RAD55 family RecA-like ATPase